MAVAMTTAMAPAMASARRVGRGVPPRGEGGAVLCSGRGASAPRLGRALRTEFPSLACQAAAPRGRGVAAADTVAGEGEAPASSELLGFDPLGFGTFGEEVAGNLDSYESFSKIMLSMGAASLAGMAGPALADPVIDPSHHALVSADMSLLYAPLVPLIIFAGVAVEGPGPPEEDFWANVLAYIRFFFSIVTGLVYVILKPFLELLKKPQTAVFVIAGGAAFIYFIKFTIDSMLDLNPNSYYLYN